MSACWAFRHLYPSLHASAEDFVPILKFQADMHVFSGRTLRRAPFDVAPSTMGPLYISFVAVCHRAVLPSVVPFDYTLADRSLSNADPLVIIARP